MMNLAEKVLKRNAGKNRHAPFPIAAGHEAGMHPIENGIPDIHDLMAPPSFDRSAPDHIEVGPKFVRNFIVSGFPKLVSVGWADNLYNYDGDLDLAIHVNPVDERVALDELTQKITQFQAQLQTELEKGSNRNITKLQQQIADLVEERRKAEQNYISLFGIQMTLNLYCNSLDQLNKEAQLLDNSLRGKKIKMMPTYLRQDQGYKSALPYGRSWMPRNYRNFSSEGLTACFPFYISEISHPTGVLIGVNTQTKTPIYIDFYDRKLLDSGNATVFGMTGSGKSFLVSLVTMRSALLGVRSAIVDPEGEYRPLTEMLGGVNIEIRPGGAIPNPFDLYEEDELDGNDRPTGKKIVRIQDKIIDLLNLVGVMCGKLENEQKSLISYVLDNTYKDFGMNEDPASLYESNVTVNERGELVHAGYRKIMPTFSDFHARLEEFSKAQGNECLIPVANALRMFTKTGVFGMFDVHTPPELEHMRDAPIVNFDVSYLNDETLRPIGMYIALSWCNEKFAKQDLSIRKRIVCDEAWMMVRKSMPGSEYTSHFLETVARRIRKRNGALLVASQNFKEFADSPQGEAVLFSTHVNIFLKQSATDLDAVQAKFKLSNGERDFLAGPKKGHFLLKMGNESTVGYAYPFAYEKYLIEQKTTAKMEPTA